MIIIKCVTCQRGIKTYPSLAKTKRYCSYNCKSIAYSGRKLSLMTRRKLKLNNAKYWLGKKRSQETIDKIRKSKIGQRAWNKGKKCPKTSGERHGMWRGGISSNGRYILIYKPKHPFAVRNYVLEHRLIMEKHIKRYLSPNEVVHHINNNPKDNKVKNLILFSNNIKHLKHHREKSVFVSNSKYCNHPKKLCLP